MPGGVNGLRVMMRHSPDTGSHKAKRQRRINAFMSRFAFGSIELRDLSVIGRKVFNFVRAMPEHRRRDITLHTVAVRSCPIKPWRKARRVVRFKIRESRKI